MILMFLFKDILPTHDVPSSLSPLLHLQRARPSSSTQTLSFDAQVTLAHVVRRLTDPVRRLWYWNIPIALDTVDDTFGKQSTYSIFG